MAPLVSALHRILRRLLCLLLGLSSLPPCLAVSSPEWYLPGVSPVQYQQGQTIPLFVNKLTSVKTQLPYRYYTLPYCTPESIHEARGNLGSSLLGDVVETSPYDIKVLENKDCEVLCSRELTEADRKFFRLMIEEDYQVNWLLDGLPGTTKYAKRDDATFMYMVGFPVGLEQRGKYFLHNHARIIIQYNWLCRNMSQTSVRRQSVMRSVSLSHSLTQSLCDSRKIEECNLK